MWGEYSGGLIITTLLILMTTLATLARYSVCDCVLDMRQRVEYFLGGSLTSFFRSKFLVL